MHLTDDEIFDIKFIIQRFCQTKNEEYTRHRMRYNSIYLKLSKELIKRDQFRKESKHLAGE